MLTEPKKLKCALIGCGDVSERYLKGVSRSSRAEMAVVMDKQLDAARRAGGIFNIPHTDSFEQICDDKTIDIVIIAVPHYLHAELAVKAAMAGKHVFCDKPIATRLSDAERMMATFKEKNRKLGVLFFMRYLKKNIKARQLLKEGVIGDVIFILFNHFSCRKESYWKQGYRGVASGDWRMDKSKSGGGQIMMNYSHYLDVIRYITRLEIKTACSFHGNLNSPEYVKVEDGVAACLQFSNGAIGTISSLTSAPGGASSQVVITGKKGRIELLDKDLRIFTTEKAGWEEIAFADQDNYDAYYDMLEDFFKAVSEGREMPITGDDGFNSLKAVKMLYGEDD